MLLQLDWGTFLENAAIALGGAVSGSVGVYRWISKRVDRKADKELITKLEKRIQQLETDQGQSSLLLQILRESDLRKDEEIARLKLEISMLKEASAVADRQHVEDAKTIERLRARVDELEKENALLKEEIKKLKDKTGELNGRIPPAANA